MYQFQGGSNWSISNDQDSEQVEKVPALLPLSDSSPHLILLTCLYRWPWAPGRHGLCLLSTTVFPETGKHVSMLAVGNNYFLMDGQISNRRTLKIQKHEAMWNYAKVGSHMRKRDHLFHKWYGMKRPMGVTILADICLLMHGPAVLS